MLQYTGLAFIAAMQVLAVAFHQARQFDLRLGVRAATRTWPAAKPDAAETIAAFDATVVDTRARTAEVVLA